MTTLKTTTSKPGRPKSETKKNLDALFDMDKSRTRTTLPRLKLTRSQFVALCEHVGDPQSPHPEAMKQALFYYFVMAMSPSPIVAKIFKEFALTIAPATITSLAGTWRVKYDEYLAGLARAKI